MERYIPKHCVWETTLRCNLKCLHCGSRAGKCRDQELNHDEAILLINDLKELGCERIILGGGEPLLRKDFANLVWHIKEMGMRPCLISNGLILPQKIKLLASLPLYAVAISLDGLEKTHNYLRQNQKSFSQVIKSFHSLSNLFIDVYAISQINRFNFSELEDLYELISHLHIDGWQIQLTNDMGRAEDLKDFRLSRKQLVKLVDFIVRYKNGPLKIYPGDDIGYYCRGQFQFQGCQGGIQVIGVEANGNVKPCLSMQKDNRFVGGNIREKSLKEIWHDPNFAAINRKAHKLAGKCASCAHARQCRGGCVGTVMSFDSLGTYPFCIRTR
ncbi:MAG: radical SAM protein [Patescibacteria group bacterium]|nr:radical SAM protein [Patescibacteria group bacterium]